MDAQKLLELLILKYIMLKSNLQPKLLHVGKPVPSSVNFQGSATAKLKVLFCAHEISKYLTSFPRRRALPHVF